jgi:hypothetical protein
MTNETYLPDTIKPRYDLTNDEIKQYENEIAGIINEQLCEDHLGVCAVWIDSSSKYADIIRTYEKSFVDDINEIMVDHESRSLFLAIVDMRGSSPRVARVSRLSCPPASEDATVGEGKTGIALVDDVIDSGQGLDATEFHEFYKDKGVDLTRCLSVETNKKVFRAEHYKGLPLAQIGYLAIFHKLEQLRAGEPSYIFAAVNSE